MGKSFKGVYSLYEKSLKLFTPSKTTIEEGIEIKDINDPILDQYVGEKNAQQLRTDVELLNGVYPELDVQDYLDGKVAPATPARATPCRSPRSRPSRCESRWRQCRARARAAEESARPARRAASRLVLILLEAPTL